MFLIAYKKAFCYYGYVFFNALKRLRMKKILFLFFSLLLVPKLYSMQNHDEEIRFLLATPWLGQKEQIMHAIKTAKTSQDGKHTISHSGFNATFCKENETVTLSYGNDKDTVTYEYLLNFIAKDESQSLDYETLTDCILQ